MQERRSGALTLLQNSGVAALDAASFCGPVYESLHVLAVFPGEMEKLARRHVRRFFSEKRLKAPSNIRTLPRFQAVALGRVPVIVQRLKHFPEFLTYCHRLGFASNLCNCLATAQGRRKRWRREVAATGGRPLLTSRQFRRLSYNFLL